MTKCGAAIVFSPRSSRCEFPGRIMIDGGRPPSPISKRRRTGADTGLSEPGNAECGATGCSNRAAQGIPRITMGFRAVLLRARRIVEFA